MLIVSCAGIYAADDNTTVMGADSVDEEPASAADDDGDTGDESIDLDISVDTGSDDEADSVEESNETGSEVVSVSLEKHATGNPLLVLMIAISIFIPFLRHD